MNEDDLYAGVLATIAMTRGVGHAEAWSIAREVAATELDVEAASLKVYQVADRAMWPNGVG